MKHKLTNAGQEIVNFYLGQNPKNHGTGLFLQKRENDSVELEVIKPCANVIQGEKIEVQVCDIV